MKGSWKVIVWLYVLMVSLGLAVLLTSPTEFGAFPQAQSPPAQKSLAASLGVFPYPKNKQSAEQQQKDEGECYAWARQQTGIDPSAPPPAPQEVKKAQGGGLAGAAGGAVAGTAIGAIAGDTGKGAAIGATAGAIRGRRQQRKANKQAEKQAQAAASQQQQKSIDVFKKAFAGCIEGRGYSVK